MIGGSDVLGRDTQAHALAFAPKRDTNVWDNYDEANGVNGGLIILERARACPRAATFRALSSVVGVRGHQVEPCEANKMPRAPIAKYPRA